MRRQALLAFVAAAVLTAPACTKYRAGDDSWAPAADSIGLRVSYKSWSSWGDGDCIGDEWGWRSASRRLAAGGEIPVGDSQFGVHLRVSRILSSDSAWVLFDPRELMRVGEGPIPIPHETPELDSALISSHPLRFGTPTVDAGMLYLVQTVPEWSEPQRKPVLTTTVVGKVEDATSGRLLAGARVALLGTAIGTRSDRNGRFALAEVPIGTGVFAACKGECYSKAQLEIRVPGDSLVFRLGRKPNCKYPD